MLLTREFTAAIAQIYITLLATCMFLKHHNLRLNDSHYLYNNHNNSNNFICGKLWSIRVYTNVIGNPKISCFQITNERRNYLNIHLNFSPNWQMKSLRMPTWSIWRIWVKRKEKTWLSDVNLYFVFDNQLSILITHCLPIC